MSTKHTDRLIYLDYHASTPMDPRVVEAMSPFFTEHFGNPHSSDHAAGWRAHKTVEAAAEKIGTCLGTDSDEVIFTSGATESNNLAILGLARRALPSRQKILVSAIEHKCVLAAARAAAPLGCTVELIPVDRRGFVDIDALQQSLRPDVLMVSVAAVNNEVGTIQPIREIAHHAHAMGAYVHTDAAQALTAGPIHIDSWDVDLLSISGHKIYGPKGIGALLIRREVQRHLEPLMYGGDQQSGLRSGTLPVPLCAGLAEAVELMNGKRVAEELQRVRALRDKFVTKLQHFDERIILNGPVSSCRHPGNANLLFPGFDARDLVAALQPRLAVSTGSACMSGMPQPSHVLRAIGLSNEESNSSLRFSMGRFTTDCDINEAAALVTEALHRIKA